MNENNAEMNFLFQVRAKNYEAVEEFLKANPKLINSLDGYDSNALIYALKDKNKELAKLLIEKGIDILQTDKFNNDSLKLAKDIGDEELIKLLEQTNHKLWKKNVALSQRRRENPFSAYNIDNFIIWEITNDYSPFSNIGANNIFNCEIRIFLGIGTLYLETIKTLTKNEMMPYVDKKKQTFAQTIFIDYITEEPEFKGDIVMQKTLWRKGLDNDLVIKKRKESLEKRGIRHIIDYDLNNIVHNIDQMINL